MTESDFASEAQSSGNIGHHNEDEDEDNGEVKPDNDVFISKNGNTLMNKSLSSNEFDTYSNFMDSGNNMMDNMINSPRPSENSTSVGILQWANKVDGSAMTLAPSTAPAQRTSTPTKSGSMGKKKRSFSDVNLSSSNVDSAAALASIDALNVKEEDNNLDSGDDENDYDDGDGDGGTGNNRKGSSARPNVREHSKAQREKRKGNISGLEQQARELTVDLNNMNCQFIAALESCRSRRQQQHRFVESLLKLWVGDESSGNNGNDTNRNPSVNNRGYEARQAKWAELFNSSGYPVYVEGVEGKNRSGTVNLGSPITMILPNTISRFSPPMSQRSYSTGVPLASNSNVNENPQPVQISFTVDHQYSTGTKASRHLMSIADIIADSTSLAVMCQNISEFGPVQICHFMLGIDVPLDGFISEDLIAIAPFYLYSKNATMCGGKFEIDIKGSLHCEFSGAGLISKIELNYDDWHLTEQLLESFGPSIYRPYSDITFGDELFHAIENKSDEGSDIDLSLAQILHLGEKKDNHVFPLVNNKHVIPKDCRKNTTMAECRIITSFDTSCIVESINPTALEQFGTITGRSLISADWMTEALTLLAQWAPYVCSLNTVRSSPETGGPTTETKCLLFPMFDNRTSESNENSESVGPQSCVPNKICWVIFNHHGNSHEKQLENIIQQFLHGTVTKFAGKLNYIGSSCYFLSFMTLLSQAELILQCDSDDDEDDLTDDGGTPPPLDSSSSAGGGGREKDLQDFLSMLEDFLKWMTAVESKIWSEENPLLEVFFFNAPESTDYSGGRTRLSRMSLMELEKSAHETKPSDPFTLSKGLAPNSQALSSSFSSIIDSNSSVSSRSSSRSSSISDAEENALHGDDREWTLFMDVLDDINNFFTMLRQSHVTSHIVSLLKTISTTKHYLLLEELNAHCLTKHMNGRICFLMKQAKDLIQHQDFERAVENLSEVRLNVCNIAFLLLITGCFLFRSYLSTQHLSKLIIDEPRLYSDFIGLKSAFLT